MPCWQEVWDNIFNLKSYKDGQKFPEHPPGVVVGASADMVLQPYGAFLAGAYQCLPTPLNAYHCLHQQEVQLGCFPPSATRQSAGSSSTA